jgi:hypothetical protein
MDHLVIHREREDVVKKFLQDRPEIFPTLAIDEPNFVFRFCILLALHRGNPQDQDTVVCHRVTNVSQEIHLILWRNVLKDIHRKYPIELSILATSAARAASNTLNVPSTFDQ